MRKFNLIAVFFLFLLSMAQASDFRLQAMGEIKHAAPDKDIKLNLLHFAGNTAWLKENDSLDWGRYSINTMNEWGNLHRFWDAQGLHENFFLFAGQKHISQNQIFFGSVQYNSDIRRGVNRAIDPRPYSNDPFVLADSVKGDFIYYGPKIFVAFNQRLFSNLYLGLSLNYAISEGLKSDYTRPEIVGRYITGSIDLAFQFTPSLTLGFSYKPFNNRDITKLVKQPNGIDPIVHRYRGEFEYSKYITTGDRTANNDGFELSPQFSFKSRLLEAIAFAGYRYLWQEIFDGTTTRVYDGNYQSEKYFFNMVVRYYPDLKKQNAFALQYAFDYLEDWAREPVAEYMIYQSWQRNHHAILGFSHLLQNRPILLVTEIQFDLFNPRKNDYLAHRLRHGQNTNLEIHLGMEFNPGQPWRFRTGYIFQKYTEDEIWNYFKNFSGHSLTWGFGYYNNSFEVESIVRYGKSMRPPTSADYHIQRDRFNFMIALKQYF